MKLEAAHRRLLCFLGFFALRIPIVATNKCEFEFLETGLKLDHSLLHHLGPSNAVSSASPTYQVKSE